MRSKGEKKRRLRFIKKKLQKRQPPRIEFSSQLLDRDIISCRRFIPTVGDRNRCHTCLKLKSAHSHGEGIDE